MGEAADIYVGTPKGRVALSWDGLGLLLDNCLYERVKELELTREAFATAIGGSTIPVPASEQAHLLDALGSWLDALAPEHRRSAEVAQLEQLRAALEH